MNKELKHDSLRNILFVFIFPLIIIIPIIFCTYYSVEYYNPIEFNCTITQINYYNNTDKSLPCINTILSIRNISYTYNLCIENKTIGDLVSCYIISDNIYISKEETNSILTKFIIVNSFLLTSYTSIIIIGCIFIVGYFNEKNEI